MTQVLIYSNGDTFGDALIKLPAIGALRAALPDARLCWLAGRGRSLYASIFRPSAAMWLDEIIDNAGVGARFRELWHRPLQSRRFDIVIDTQQFLKTTLILRRIRHGCFLSATAGFRLSDRTPPERRRCTHMQDRLLQLFSLAAGRTLRPVTPIPIPALYHTLAAERLPETRGYVGLAPGAGQDWKKWPLERFVNLARQLSRRGYRPVFLLGPDDRHWQRDLAQAVPCALFPESAEGGDGGPYLVMALAGRLDAAVANDSGTGHMLAAGGAPLVSLFGPTCADKFAPRGPRTRLVQARDFGNTRMEAIPESAVLGALDELLADGCTSC